MKRAYWLFIIAAGILVVALGTAYVKLAEHDALIILHFDQYRGIDFFGSRVDVFNMLGIGIGISAINFLLSRVFRNRDVLLAQLLAGTSVLVALLLFIAVLVIISVN